MCYQMREVATSLDHGNSADDLADYDEDEAGANEGSVKALREQQVRPEERRKGAFNERSGMGYCVCGAVAGE